MIDEQFDKLEQEKEHCFHCDKEIEEGLECEDCKKNRHEQDLRLRIIAMGACIGTLRSEIANLKRQLARFLGCGDPECGVSTGICEHLTFGKGDLSHSGYWEEPCQICARAHEEVWPEDGPCWPFEDGYREKLSKMLEDKNE